MLQLTTETKNLRKIAKYLYLAKHYHERKPLISIWGNYLILTLDIMLVIEIIIFELVLKLAKEKGILLRKNADDDAVLAAIEACVKNMQDNLSVVSFPERT